MPTNQSIFSADTAAFIVDSQLTLVFPKQEQLAVIRWAMEQFTEWLLNGQLFEIHNDFNPSWDCSGRLVPRPLTDDDYQEIMQETLAEWMDNQYSGNIRASYVSGCGLFHDTYRTVVEDYSQNAIISLLRSQVATDDVWFDLSENDELSMFEWDLQSRIMEAIECIPSKDAYLWCKKRVLQQLKQCEATAQARQAFIKQCNPRVIAFQTKFLPWLPTEFIDKLSWKNHTIELQLKQALCHADNQTLHALITVGLQGNFSNSVRMLIEQTLQQVYQTRK